MGGGGTRSALRAAAVAAALLLGTGAAGAAPERIVSLNLCADRLLFALADREQIASVTYLARDPRRSAVVDEAAGLPVNHGKAEEVLVLNPDLVLAGRYGAWDTTALLGRLGVEVVELEVPATLAGVRALVRRVARAVGHPERGERLVARMDSRLAALARPAAEGVPHAVPDPARQAARGPRQRPRGGPGERRLRAVVYGPRGYAAGAGTLADGVLAAAGVDNLAARLGLTGYGLLPLERLLSAGPDLLIVERPQAGPPGPHAILGSRGEPPPSLAKALLAHPALARAFPPERRVAMPAHLWTCGGPWLADAVAVVADAARRLAAEEAAP